ncbi:MAG: NADH-quinone oxidoreductase subunit G [Planctomycetota bacterium]|jgi:NADH-quinone oxidoreductase subunit G
MPKLLIDGREITVEPGTTVIQAAEQLGIFVPRYCWHPGLSIAGNCRICQVEVVQPKLRFPCTVACNLMCSDGMEILTDSEEARKARADVMEFLLINHPLDCPICDQAGECILQEYSYSVGHDHSRFDEMKVHKSKRVAFSDKIMFDGERCILCTRCVRFCEEVAGNEELAVVERGDHGEIAVAYGDEIKNPYSMCVVDLCPVGALTSRDFRFKSRVWFLTDVPSVCTSCARNCSITVGTRWDKIMRLTPRENLDVNQWWMCDHGRLDYKYVHADDRLGKAYVKKDGRLSATAVDEAVERAHDLVNEFVVGEGGDGLFGLVSARLTNEEMFLARRYLSEVVGTGNLDSKPRTGEGDDILVCEDKNPNSAGARLIGIAPESGAVGLDELPEAVKSGRIKAAVVFGDDLDDRPEALEALDSLEFLVVMDYRLSLTAKKADVVLPGVTWAEKEGTVVNVDGWISKLNPAIRPPAEARPDLELLADLLTLAAPDGEKAPRKAREVFAALGEAVPAFAGIRYSDLYAKSARVAEEAVSAAD